MNGNKYNALAKAIYEAILQHGETILEKKRFTKIVKDLNGFLDMPETEKIIKILVNRGTLKRLYLIRNEKSIMISELICFEGNNLKQYFKYSDDFLVYVFNSIMSTFEGIDNGYLDKEDKMSKDIEISSEIKEMTTETTIEVMPVPTDINDEMHENVLDKVEENLINCLHISNIPFEIYNPRKIIKWIKNNLDGNKIHKVNVNNRTAYRTVCWDSYVERSMRIYALDTSNVYEDGCEFEDGCEILIEYCKCKSVSQLKKGDYVRTLINCLDKVYGKPSVVIDCDMDEYLNYLERWEKKSDLYMPTYTYNLKLRAYVNKYGTILCELEFSYGYFSLHVYLTPHYSEDSDVVGTSYKKKYRGKKFGVIYPLNEPPYVVNNDRRTKKAIFHN